ncbi:MAG TPA: membrane protein insertase YidC [Vicinamibacterales bacterium]|nr:membrane protein insertase YidC [Vicinamibacterales bacterium]
MERRVLIAISLSFLVLFLYQTFITPARPPQPPASSNQTPPASPVAGVTTPGNLSPESIAAPLPPVTTVIGEPAEREIAIETKRVRAVFTNRGGRLRHWWLKDYKNRAGQVLDLVPESVPAPLPVPFSLRVDDTTTTARLNDLFYRSNASSASIDGTSQPVTVTFDLETGEGLRAQKTFELTPDGYDILFSASVQEGTASDGNGAPKILNPTIDWGPGLGDDIARTPPGSFLSPNYTYAPQAIYHENGSVQRVSAASLGAGTARDGVFRWVGIDDHYFISAIIQPPAPLHVEYAPVVIATPSTPSPAGRFVSYSARFPAPPQNARFFLGPKQLDALRAVDPEFTRAIYFGMFSWLAVPLLGALKWVHGYIGNWGWSIIALTILINIAMFPLRHKSVVSMRKMQELQPQMKAIQDRYAKYKITDPERQKMNQEVMELYKARGVNPASGCVPMLLTMPFLFAFYSMLSQAIELRGAEFAGWIHDLAARDPYYVTPLLMGATMVWQQRLTPSTADPTQQKMMMFMPFMFTFIFLGQPSGLAIYWLVSNLWGIGQQYFTNYLIGPPKVHNVRPPAERRVKKG